MSRIKAKESKLKVSQSAVVPKCPETPSFSFQYLTTNKDYNFEKLDKRQKLEWKSALVERMIEISQKSWQSWLNMDKKQGFETIPANRIHFNPNGYELSDDEKIIIFRFNSQKGRILGIKGNGCSVYYVIGFDTDYSAYDHGA